MKLSSQGDLQSNPEWDSILSAAQKNKATEIKRLVEKCGVSPNHTNRAGQSALHIAALWGNGRITIYCNTDDLFQLIMGHSCYYYFLTNQCSSSYRGSSSGIRSGQCCQPNIWSYPVALCCTIIERAQTQSCAMCSTAY